jgi:hypothetical protein
MLRSLKTAQTLNPAIDGDIIKLKGCPDCGGRGWFCDNPFIEHGKTYKQCPTCLAAFIHHGKHGTLPEDIEKAMSL